MNIEISTKFGPHIAKVIYTFDFPWEPSRATAVGAVLDKSKMAAIQIRVMS